VVADIRRDRGSEVAITVESMFSMNRAVATISGIGVLCSSRFERRPGSGAVSTLCHYCYRGNWKPAIVRDAACVRCGYCPLSRLPPLAFSIALCDFLLDCISHNESRTRVKEPRERDEFTSAAVRQWRKLTRPRARRSTSNRAFVETGIGDGEGASKAQPESVARGDCASFHEQSQPRTIHAVGHRRVFTTEREHNGKMAP